MLVSIAVLSALTACARAEKDKAVNPTVPVSNTAKKEAVPVTKTNLHYMLPDGFQYRTIGDVHPYFDAKTKTWYMFYLDTSGQFHTKLLASKDAISWQPVELSITGSSHNYAALGIVESEGKYYSYYAEYLASVSDDLIHWNYAGIKYVIPQDTHKFPGGMRDPFVTYDPDTKRYYSIGLSYPKRAGGEYISNLAINQSKGDSLKSWNKEFKTVFKENFDGHDPEVPQLVKIGNRWYVITSIFGNSAHGVGATSYLIGDPGKNPYEVDWHAKTLHTLTSEDLCAAQLVAFGDRHLLFGWIPKDYMGSTWGGNINLALEVFAHPDGTLGTKIYDGISDLIRGEQAYKLDSPVQVTSAKDYKFPSEKRMDLELAFSMTGDEFKLQLVDKKVEVILRNNGADSAIEIKSNSFTTSTLKISADALSNDNRLRVIAEGNVIEVFLNDAYTVHSRIGLNLGKDTVRLSTTGSVDLKQAAVYKLKFFEDLK